MVGDLKMSYTPSVSSRTVTSGSTTIAANTTSDVVTFSRSALERISPFAFDTDDSLNIETGVVGQLAVTTGPEVGLSIRRTANANEGKLTIKNANLASTRTVDWAVVAVTP